jgi:hypothetical protein
MQVPCPKLANLACHRLCNIMAALMLIAAQPLPGSAEKQVRQSKELVG